MSHSSKFLSPSEAARRLGVSTKALRLYEQRGLIAPVRSEAGWRTYGPAELARAAKIAHLRALGLSLAEVGRALNGDGESLAVLLADHHRRLQGQAREIGETIEKVRAHCADLARPEAPGAQHGGNVGRPAVGGPITLRLPWPWDGETFELGPLRAVNYITGPLGCGKTRLVQALAERLPDARFLGLDRLEEDETHLTGDPEHALRVDRVINRMIEEGAANSHALRVLIAAFEQRGSAVLVVDMVEQDLDEATQAALIGHLRARGAEAAPVFLMTRSSAILDMALVGPHEAVIHCPANHSPPAEVAPYPGAPGYEAVTSCLASPQVRARTAGVVATWAQSDV